MQSITNLQELSFVQNVKNDFHARTENDITLKLLSVRFYLLLASFISFDTAKFLNIFEPFFYLGLRLKQLMDKLLSHQSPIETKRSFKLM